MGAAVNDRSGGALVVCATPIGNLEDITLRALAELRTASVLACEDTRRTRTLCRRYGIEAPLISLHEHNEAARIPELLGRLAEGERVALVSDAGMPAVSDPGSRLVAAAHRAGHPVTVLPGASAVTAAAAVSGLGELGFTFCGFLPRTAPRLDALLDRLDRSGLAVVAFESPRRLPGSLRRLRDRDPGRPAVVCRELTKLHEEVTAGSVAELANRFSEPPKGEVTLVLAAAAAAPTELADADLRELGRALGASRAAELAARLTGTSRNAAYRRLTGG
jgi:16S rRNA (cytidine1402-2'-O)-methyltransferase